MREVFIADDDDGDLSNGTPHGCDLVTLLEPGPTDWKEARNRNLRIGFELMLTPLLRELPEARARQGEILRRCTDWIDTGQLRLVVSRSFPLEQAAEALLNGKEIPLLGTRAIGCSLKA